MVFISFLFGERNKKNLRTNDKKIIQEFYVLRNESVEMLNSAGDN